MRPAIMMSALLALSSASPALAEGDATDPAAQTAIQSIITQQLNALQNDDGSTAESFASPGIQEKFPDPAAFMNMVHQSYGALVHPKSTHFGDLSQTALGLVQKMTIVDSKGGVWTAAYTMTQVDGQWRISGCFMLKSEAVDA